MIYTIQNNTNRTILGFKGVIIYLDKFGDVVHRHNVGQTVTIKPRRTLEVKNLKLGWTHEVSFVRQNVAGPLSVELDECRVLY